MPAAAAEGMSTADETCGGQRSRHTLRGRLWNAACVAGG